MFFYKALILFSLSLITFNNGFGQNGITESQQRELEKKLSKSTFDLPNGFPKREINTKDQIEKSISGTSGVSEREDKIDQDGDGLTDEEELQLKTNPRKKDTDGDGLYDGWEVFVTDGVNLREEFNASPLHKDIFVEMDYMSRGSAKNELKPSQKVLNEIERIFAEAPVSNEDGVDGIHIHLIMGNEVPYDTILNPYRVEFYTLKNKHFKSKYSRFFHYMIWANSYYNEYRNTTESSGISMNIPHSDFIVTLGTWNENIGGTDEEKIGTFIHELGHNLGLRHGSNDDTNQKPNHLSVMNYLFQIHGVWQNNHRDYTYQSIETGDLDELDLRENLGISIPQNSPYDSTLYFSIDKNLYITSVRQPIDWNISGTIERQSLQININDDNDENILAGGIDEWNSLIYNGGSIGLLGNKEAGITQAKKSASVLKLDELTEDLKDKLKNINR